MLSYNFVFRIIHRTPNKEDNPLLGAGYAKFEGFLHHYINLNCKEKFMGKPKFYLEKKIQKYFIFTYVCNKPDTLAYQGL